jgi:peptide/nickel transport system ATP-binding protein
MALLDITDLKVYFSILKGKVRAVDGVTFTLDRGETMGLVGESGCGKTTTAFAVMRLLPDNGEVIAGDIVFNDQVVAWGSLAQEASQVISDLPEEDGWVKPLEELISRREKRLEEIKEFLPQEFLEDDTRVIGELKDALASGIEQAAMKKSVEKILKNELKGTLGTGRRRRKKRERRLEDSVRSIRWAEASMIFQSAMNAFNPVYKVGDQIVEAILTHQDAFDYPHCPICNKDYKDLSKLKKNERGIYECPVHEKPMEMKGMSKKDAKEIALELFDLVGLSRARVNGYPHEFSGGMRQRAMIAMALACNPYLIIADEPTTALDVIMQDRILAEINKLQKRLNIAMLIITHDISVVAEVSEKIGIMYAGKLVEHGDIKSIFKKPSHPYTKGLLEAFPSIKGERKRLKSIPGSPPDLSNPPSGCRFHPRCPMAAEKCKSMEPDTVEVSPGHFSACWFAKWLYTGEMGV